MGTYRQIGTGTTDQTGTATCPYTGTGAGEVTLIASTSSSINESSLVSETYSIYDVLFKDMQITYDTYQNYWKGKDFPQCSVSVSDGTVTLTTDVSKTSSTFSQINTAQDTYIDAPVVIEYDLIEQTNFGLMLGIKRENDTWWTTRQYVGHCKAIITDTNFKFYCNNRLIDNVDGSYVSVKPYWQSSTKNGNGKVVWKNFIIYKG